MLAFGLPGTAVEGEVSVEGEIGREGGLDLLEVVEMTLAYDPNISLVESQLSSSRGALLSARGRFDPILSTGLTRSSAQTPLDEMSSSESTTLQSVLGVTQELRTGLSLEPSLDLERTEDGDPTINQATVSFAVRQPLLRGRGRSAVAAGERAAEREVEASRLDFEHTIALRLRSVISLYWSVAAAMLDLDVLRTTEASSRRLLETTRNLIAADLTPAAEIVQLEADLAAREANRIAGEQRLFEARLNLDREIGLEPDRMGLLPLPEDSFPKVDPDGVPPAGEGPLFTRQALERRADLRAAQERLAGAEILLRAADNALKPRLDLVFTPSYSGLVEDGDAGAFFSPLFRNIPGLSTSLGFNLSWPTLNRRAQGDLIQAQAAVDQSALRVELNIRSIGAEVPIALEAVRRNALQVETTARAVRLFERTVDNEEKKLRGGSSTLIDVITQRDRLTAARRRLVSAQLALAFALVELRFQTGTLLATDGEAGSIRYEHITTIPFQEASR